MLRRFSILCNGLVAVFGGGAAALAHPGHGVIPADNAAHWFEPVHVVPLVILGLGAAVFAYRRLRSQA